MDSSPITSADTVRGRLERFSMLSGRGQSILRLLGSSYLSFSSVTEKNLKTRDKIFTAFGIVFAIVFVRLGFWQLGRLQERKALNRELRSRAETAPVNFSELPKDTGDAHFRRVTLKGSYDYDHEIVLTNRTRNGSPGVHMPKVGSHLSTTPKMNMPISAKKKPGTDRPKKANTVRP